MQNKRFLLFSLFIAVAMMAASCSKDSDDPQEEKDTGKPEIYLSLPVNGASSNPGDSIEFSVRFVDNKELGGYKIDVHFNDGHEHKSVTNEGKWSFEKSYTFEPGSTDVTLMHDDVRIPTEVDGVPIYAGDYHFLVYCTDKAGNEEFVARNIIIVDLPDETGPVIEISLSPATDQEFTRGDTIRMNGKVADNKRLNNVLVALMRSSSTEEMVNETDAFAIIFNGKEQLNGPSNFSFASSIIFGQAQDNNVPPRDITWARGNFYLIVKASDDSGNITFSEKYPVKLK
ncbi:MAG: DUF4625 domain-containing protein [Bacteroidales bacterium]|nr:DUF4625 domain-containing protein [Bacteroidales bacterium]